MWKTDLHRDPRRGSSGPDVDKGVGTFVENPSIPVDSVIDALRTDWGEDLQMEYSTTLPHPSHRNIHNPTYSINLSQTAIFWLSTLSIGPSDLLLINKRSHFTSSSDHEAAVQRTARRNAWTFTSIEVS